MSQVRKHPHAVAPAPCPVKVSRIRLKGGEVSVYRGTSLIRKLTPPGSYRRPMPRVLSWSQGDGRFLMGQVPLYLGLQVWRDRALSRATVDGFARLCLSSSYLLL